MSDLSELKKKTAYVAFLIVFACLGPALFLALYPDYEIVGFTFFALCIFFCLVLFQARPKQEEFEIEKEAIDKELTKIKRPVEICESYLKYVLILIILLPISAGLVYWFLGNIFVTDLLLAATLIISGIFFGCYYYYTSLQKSLKRIKIQ